MKKLLLKRLLSYSHQASSPVPLPIYTLVVTQVQSYHTFLPWCSKSLWLGQDRAELEISFLGRPIPYVSRVMTEKWKDGVEVRSRAQEGNLFRVMESVWRLSLPHTQISYQINFEFQQPYLQKLSTVFLHAVGKELVSAFEAEARRRWQAASSPAQPLKQVIEKKQVVLAGLSEKEIWEGIEGEMAIPERRKRQVVELVGRYRECGSTWRQLMHQIHNRALYW